MHVNLRWLVSANLLTTKVNAYLVTRIAGLEAVTLVGIVSFESVDRRICRSDGAAEWILLRHLQPLPCGLKGLRLDA